MGHWFSDLVEKFAAVSALHWAVVGVLVLLAVVLGAMTKNKRSKTAIGAVWALFVAAVALLVWFASFPVEVEQGANTSAAFVYNPLFWSLQLCLFGVGTLFLLLRRQRFTTRMLSTGALCAALAFLLSCLTIYRLPQGGSITPASMLPVFVFAYLYGPVPGMAVGTIDGMLQLIQGAYVVHPVQFLMDYILPFAVLGIAGLFRKEKQWPLGILLACFVRYCIHVVSGVVFFASYAPAGQNVWLYSSIYNGTYMLPETMVCLAVSLMFVFGHTLARLKAAAD